MLAETTAEVDLSIVPPTKRTAGTPPGLHAKEFFVMCDYSLQSVRARPAKIGDQLVTKKFGTFTRGFPSLDDLDPAVCVLPGTELAFARDVRHADLPIVPAVEDWFTRPPNSPQRTAIFRQINKDVKSTPHDALEFPDGQVVLLTRLRAGQKATVLQLPAEQRIAPVIRPAASCCDRGGS